MIKYVKSQNKLNVNKNHDGISYKFLKVGSRVLWDIVLGLDEILRCPMTV